MYQFIGKKNKMYELKLNSNCKQEEKTGEGPGSCSNGKNIISNNIKDLFNTNIIIPSIKIQSSISGSSMTSKDPIEAIAAYDKNTNTIILRDIDWNAYTKMADKKEPSPISHTKENTINHEIGHIIAKTNAIGIKYLNPIHNKAVEKFFIENGGSIGVSSLIGKYGSENFTEVLPEAIAIYISNNKNNSKTDDRIIKLLIDSKLI